jgi:hypothetical protein
MTRFEGRIEDTLRWRLATGDWRLATGYWVLKTEDWVLKTGTRLY